MDSTAKDAYWMAKAIQLAKKGRFTTTPNPNVGCVIVKDEQLVGQGYHIQSGGSHAEVHALAEAGAKAEGATAYVTLEPCSHTGKTPPCAQALINAKVARVVCAMTDPNPLVAGQGLDALRASGIDVVVGVLEHQAEALNQGFLKRMRTQTPFIQVKMAASLDGGTAMASGESQWITGPDARADVQNYRAQACAIVTGVGTILADDPSMNVRSSQVVRQPVRIILDTHLRTPTTAKLLALPGETVIVHSCADNDRIQSFEPSGVSLVNLPMDPSSERISLAAFIDWAGQRYNRLWIEAGAKLAGCFITEHYADEVVLYQAPVFLGATAKPVIERDITELANKIQFTVLDQRFVGVDVRWVLQPST
ncbi:bifunctional diaminohydroxyphosphoribosylaminopyrimidine deaminase/5-amino-6-(5-phosphoribosylamino)uracil reductase RibD [Reinekea sp.]|jgi:diaminohydroxyphosphoribosylaminopyrimidine deaminase/5-amino-6-(5-phosphoribosylamino)uracil reductase|uniref:bifunctional diaminohydroxyphosphoribosylaminopyrimidine deaminase/5-amino-6-(5-phosphoribosylamino)uracil reductase RibD n=1 Tax=Reinekea sp. TaxID=1970455 RepID=UPI0039895559